tara:strand:- start:637 stop:909 length:273 start_codon:yes stop_codon:yes gene_type:complete
MTNEQILRWLVNYGREWVEIDTLLDSWTNVEINRVDAHRNKYIERYYEPLEEMNEIAGRVGEGRRCYNAYYKLSDYAIEQLENMNDIERC